MVSTILVNSYNFPPPPPTEYNSPLDWTLIEAWDTRNATDDNEMASIDAAFSGQPRGSSNIIWSPDGTILTMASTAEDRIRSFSVSLPFDPDTATLIATRSVTNPIHMFANKDGSLIWLDKAADTYTEYPASNFVIGGGAILSTMTKAEAGFTGSTDLNYYARDDFAYVICNGDTVSGFRVRRIDFSPSGDLDNPALGSLSTIDWTASGGIGSSKISKDETSIYRGRNALGVETLKMTVPGDTSTMSQFAIDDMIAEVGGWFIDAVWINPEDTTEVWCVGDNGGVQLARMATNV